MNTICLLLAVLCCLAVTSARITPARLTTPKTSKSSKTTKSSKTSKSSKSSASKALDLRGGSIEDLLDWRYFAAGAICAGFSHGVTTPIDVVKTRMQTDPEHYTRGVMQAAKDIVSTEGLGFLLAGLGPTVVGYGFEGGLKFGFYEFFKVVLKNFTPVAVFNLLLASVGAGAIAAVVLCPMEEARIKMVGDADWANENVVSSLVRLAREGGLFSSFAGLPAMLSKQVPYTMGKQVTFDLITKALYSLLEAAKLSKDAWKWPISLASAFLSAVIACVTSQPGDMILSTTYKGSGTKSFNEIVGDIYKKHGLSGFYLGLTARLMHVTSIITSQLVVYDLVKGALGLPLTGSH